MKEVFEKIISYIHSEISRTTTWSEHHTQINIENYVRQLQEEYESNDGWIPCSSGKMPADYGEDWVQIQIQEIDTGYLWIPRTGEYRRGSWWVLGYDEDVRVKPPFEVIAWQPLPTAYQPKEEHPTNNWIPVTDHLPEPKHPYDDTEKKYYQVRCKDGRTETAEYLTIQKNCWIANGCEVKDVVEWRVEEVPEAKECNNKECCYNQGEACPAAGGCGGYEEKESRE